MKIAIISIFSFPFGMASTNRILAICQGLIEAGDEPTVIMPFPPEPHTSKNKFPDIGEWKGIRYVHLSGRKRNSNVFLRGIAIKVGIRYYLGIKRLKRWLKSNPQDVVIVYGDDCLYLNDTSRIIKDSGAKALFIFDEYPTPIREYGADRLPDSKVLKFSKILPLFDGYISINKVLADFYNDIVKKPTLELSMIVDTGRFSSSVGQRREWMTYMGQILWDKDNIINIIEAFNLIKAHYPALTFHIFGKGDRRSLQMIESKIKFYQLEERVILEGFAPNDRVTEIMETSKILVSSQPDNQRVRGVLSTKLAEYVASATPTLMCDVGANRDYLSDEDCFFTVPDNPEAYAQRLKTILNDYSSALKVARNGSETIEKKYSTTAQGQKLSRFLSIL